MPLCPREVRTRRSTRTHRAERRGLLGIESSFCVRGSVAHNVASPPEVLARLAGDKAPVVRASVARNVVSPPAVLTRLARDKAHAVREEVACNNNTLLEDFVNPSVV